jgi:two-component system, response regulator YesN
LSNIRDSAARAAVTFEKAFCMRCFAADAEKEDGLFSREGDPFCAVCANEQLRRLGELKCADMHRYGIVQAEKWGGKYEYQCPAGLTFISAALQKRAGYGLVAGPFLMVELRDFIANDLDRFFKGTSARSLRNLSSKLPFYSCERVSYIASILSMITCYAAERDSLEIRIMEQVAKNQSEVFYSLYDMRDSRSSDYPIGQEKILQGYIAQGNKPESQKMLNEILGRILFCSGGDFEFIKARTIELIVIISRAAIEGGADITEVFGLNSDFLNDIKVLSSPDELYQWLAKVLIRFTNSVFDLSKAKHSYLIKRVIEYIKKNYMNKISLNDISGYTNLSVSYLSRIFNEEMGCNLNTYINRVRIDNAKLFLLNDSIPLTEAAYLSGFDDQSYFSKIFKKVAGVSPGKYRSKKGNI